MRMARAPTRGGTSEEASTTHKQPQADTAPKNDKQFTCAMSNNQRSKNAGRNAKAPPSDGCDFPFSRIPKPKEPRAQLTSTDTDRLNNAQSGRNGHTNDKTHTCAGSIGARRPALDWHPGIVSTRRLVLIWRSDTIGARQRAPSLVAWHKQGASTCACQVSS